MPKQTTQQKEALMACKPPNPPFLKPFLLTAAAVFNGLAAETGLMSALASGALGVQEMQQIELAGQAAHLDCIPKGVSRPCIFYILA